jgi:hypothetical protein
MGFLKSYYVFHCRGVLKGIKTAIAEDKEKREKAKD